MYGGPLPGQEKRKYGEFDCLNLTISAPKHFLGDEGKKLPVMVYVHGGGFRVNAGHVSALHGEFYFIVGEWRLIWEKRQGW